MLDTDKMRVNVGYGGVRKTMGLYVRHGEDGVPVKPSQLAKLRRLREQAVACGLKLQAMPSTKQAADKAIQELQAAIKAALQYADNDGSMVLISTAKAKRRLGATKHGVGKGGWIMHDPSN